MRVPTTPTVFAAGILLFALAGCGSDTPTLAPVRGTVYYRNVPLTGGTIVFTPDAARGNSGPFARAEIGPDGVYVLKTDAAFGCVPGCHRVTVIAVESAAASASNQPFAVSRSLVPAKYRDPEEVEYWKSKDPIPAMERYLDLHGLWSDEWKQELEARGKQELEQLKKLHDLQG